MPSVTSSDLELELDALVDALMASYEDNDAEAYLRAVEPGSMVWLSDMNSEMSVEENAALLTELHRQMVKEFHYVNIRRQRTASGYLQEFDCTSVAHSGAQITFPGCTVARVKGKGRIEHIREYLDTSMIAFAEQNGMGPAPSA